MTAMRDSIHLEARMEMDNQNHRRARLNRLDTLRAIARGLGVHRTSTQKNEKRRARQGR